MPFFIFYYLYYFVSYWSFGCEQEMLGGKGAFCTVVGSFVVADVRILEL